MKPTWFLHEFSKFDFKLCHDGVSLTYERKNKQPKVSNDIFQKGNYKMFQQQINP